MGKNSGTLRWDTRDEFIAWMETANAAKLRDAIQRIGGELDRIKVDLTDTLVRDNISGKERRWLADANAAKITKGRQIAQMQERLGQIRREEKTDGVLGNDCRMGLATYVSEDKSIKTVAIRATPNKVMNKLLSSVPHGRPILWTGLADADQDVLDRYLNPQAEEEVTNVASEYHSESSRN